MPEWISTRQINMNAVKAKIEFIVAACEQERRAYAMSADPTKPHPPPLRPLTPPSMVDSINLFPKTSSPAPETTLSPVLFPQQSPRWQRGKFEVAGATFMFDQMDRDKDNDTGIVTRKEVISTIRRCIEDPSKTRFLSCLGFPNQKCFEIDEFKTAMNKVGWGMA